MKKILLLLFICPSVIFGQIPEPKPNTYVNDFANVLTPGQLEQLNKQIRAVETATSVQIAVVLINDLPGDMVIEDYARELGRKWHVGNAHNGLVYIAALNAHQQRLEVADQLQGVLPDAKAKEILQDMRPFFRKKDYFGGVFHLLQLIQTTIKPEVADQKKLGDDELAKKKANSEDYTWLIWTLCIIGIGTIIILIIQHRRQKKIAKENEELRNNEALGVYRNSGSSYSGNYNSYEDSPTYYPTSPSSGSNSSSGSDSGSSSSSSDYGSWGSGSSDSGSSSSDSGFSGGGSSDSW